ncbi:MAG TPA: SRPBCC family protein [Jatrophihabitans sp.]|jgi:carbon monoxide dehydrogenase subunit G
MSGEMSTQSIVIDAPPAKVMAAIADFAHYPDWAASLSRVQVLEQGADGRAHRVGFTLNTGVVNDEYELEYTWVGDERVQWHLVKGQVMRSQDGVYVLQPQDGGTHVTYSLAVDLGVPLLGMLKRKAERMVMDTALKELKKYVESQGVLR